MPVGVLVSSGVIRHTVLLLHPEQLLLQYAELILDILHVASKRSLNIEILATTDLGQPLLYSLANLL